MARAIAASGIRNLRSDVPTVRDALPWFLLVLAPGVLVLIMSVVLGLGRPFRGLGTITVLEAQKRAKPQPATAMSPTNPVGGLTRSAA